jgi:hypothetical protein
MLMTIRSIYFLAAFFLFASICRAGDDLAVITPADWAGANASNFTEFYVDKVSNMPTSWTNREYHATAALIGAHAHAKDNTALAHTHTKLEWGDAGCPSAAEADVYWNARFSLKANPGAVMKHQTCHEWALTQCPTAGGAGGVYTYTLKAGAAGLGYVFANDVAAVANNAVLAGDVIKYGDHSTFVSAVQNDGAAGKKPQTLKWKWKGSGIYTYVPPNTKEYNTPMCEKGFEGDADTTKTLPNQTWVWNADFRKNGTVYH